MNDLVGEKVKSVKLGEGTITEVKITANGTVVTAFFPNSYSNAYRCGSAYGSVAKEYLRDDEDRKIREESKRAKGLNELKALSIRALNNGQDIIKNIDRNKYYTSAPRVFIVHQGKTFAEEYRGGYVWAPASGIFHHEKMTEINDGDIIFHYVSGSIKAIGVALSKCFSYPRPAELTGHGWGHIGYRVEVKYHLLASPLYLGRFIPQIIKYKAYSHSSFDYKGDACQGYMYNLEIELAKIFRDSIKNTYQSSSLLNVLNRIV